MMTMNNPIWITAVTIVLGVVQLWLLIKLLIWKRREIKELERMMKKRKRH